jgi:hypothetical protein
MTNKVGTPSTEYNAMSAHWHMVASLRGGTTAMRHAARAYLPQYPGETMVNYDNRLNISVLTNLYKRVVEKMVAKPLKDPIALGDDVPPEIEVLTRDVDNLGTDIDTFASDILTAAIDDGLTHILIDAPSVPTDVQGDMPDGSLSVAQEAELQLRPYARHVRAMDLIGWKVAVQGGRKTLTQIRVLERVKEDDPDNEFAQKIVTKVRVIEPGVYRLYRHETGGDKDQWMLEESGPSPDEIPLVTFYTNQTGFMQAEPLLLDIAHLNVAHWQSDSDQTNILHIVRVPLLFTTGLGEEENEFVIEVGPNSLIRAPKGATMDFVEHTGKGIEAGRQHLKDIEERILMLSLELLVKQPGRQQSGATGRHLDQMEADSVLGAVARKLEGAIEQVLAYFAKFLGLGDSGGNVSVFKDFSLDPNDVDAVKQLHELRKNGDLSKVSFWSELKRRRLLPDDFDPEAELALLDLEHRIDGDDDEPAANLNAPGDFTAPEDDHVHELLPNGRTDEYTDSETGETHSHDWDPRALRTTVEAGHAHILVARSQTGESHAKPADAQDDADDAGDDGQEPEPGPGARREDDDFGREDEA